MRSTATRKAQTLTNAKFQLGRFADKQVFPIFVLALLGIELMLLTPSRNLASNVMLNNYLVKKMKYYLTLLVTLLLGYTSFSQRYLYVNEDCVIEKKVKKINILHIKSTIDTTKTTIEKDETIGQVQDYPPVLSKEFDRNIKRSKEYYDNRDYINAAKELEIAYNKEPENLFIAENYARALYWIDAEKEKSYYAYRKIVMQLDKQSQISESILTIDYWHRESYWKLATLYLDLGNWSEAFVLINKFIISIQENKGERIYNQALEYATECLFNMKEFEFAKHFAERTLFYDPQNDYAKEVLSKIKK